MLTQSEFLDKYYSIGESKAKAKFARTFLLGVLAGLLIGLGGAVTNMATHTIASVSVAKIISGALFPFGLIMVIFTGAELFTGNCLLSMPVAEKRITIKGLLKNWIFSYTGNFVGAALLAALLCLAGQFNISNGALAVSTMKVAVTKCNINFGSAIILGIFCNLLVCLAVMASLSAKDAIGRAAGAYFPIFFFVMCGFEHCVANMYYIPAGLFAKGVTEYASLAVEAGLDLSTLTWGNFLINNLLPVTIGNIIGGVLFGLLIWYAYRQRGDGSNGKI